MPEKINFELVSPERLLVSEPVDMVVVPGVDGDFGALPRHSPLISTIRPGVVDVYVDGRVSDRIFVAGGFAEVNEERCTVLAEEAIQVGKLNRDDAEARLKAAREAIEEAENEHAMRAAERALAVAEAMRATIAETEAKR